MTRRHRNAASGRFAAARDAEADPERHVAERVRALPVLRIERMNDHMTKLHLGDGRVVHHFTAADGPGADYHDHPWRFSSTILAGGYVEQVMDITRPHDPPQEIERRPGDTFRNEAGTIHRIIRLLEPECWTVITPGEHERTPGFYQFRPDGAWHRLWHDPEFTRLP